MQLFIRVQSYICIYYWFLNEYFFNYRCLAKYYIAIILYMNIYYTVSNIAMNIAQNADAK